MVEIVDHSRPIDNIEGHESDEDGCKKVKNEGHSLLVVRNGKYPEHGIVSLNRKLNRAPYMVWKCGVVYSRYFRFSLNSFALSFYYDDYFFYFFYVF